MKTPRLANAELAIMQLLWDEAPLTARRIRERVYPGARKPQHGTVQRLLLRLEEKGFVKRDRSMAVHLFSPAVSREAYASSQLEAIAGNLSGASLAPLITHLLEEKKISRDEVQRLRRLLDAQDGPEDAS